MTYNPAIPQATDTISASQPPILTNFSQLDVLFGKDHVPYTFATQTARGRHLQVTFNALLIADPGLTKPIASLYTKGPVGGPAQLYFQNDTPAASVFQLTGLPFAASNILAVSSGGFVTPGGGVKVCWGRTNAGDGGLVTFALGGFSARPWVILCNPIQNTNSVRGAWPADGNGNITATTFIVRQTGVFDVGYVAIGPA